MHSATWKDVENRIEQERALVASIAASGATDIRSFFPELQPAAKIETFSNTLGSFLIPDLLTSRHVVVDLFEFESPKRLIEKYAVDREFLSELRERRLITLCASADPEFFKPIEWMYPLLAHPKTIFRSVRLQAFFAAIDPGFPERKEKQRIRLKRIIEDLSSEEFSRLRDAASASAYELNNADILISYLSTVLERGVIFDSDATAGAREAFDRDMLTGMSAVLQNDAVLVKPHSQALGGEIKFDHVRWARLFQPRSIERALVHGDARIQAVNTLLAECKLNLTESRLTAAHFWDEFTQRDRIDLLEHLENPNEREDLLKAENTLRKCLAEEGQLQATHTSILRFCQRLAENQRPFRFLGRNLPVAAPVIFDAIITGYSQASSRFVFDLGAGYLAHKIAPALRPAAEKFFPTLRVVRIVRNMKVD